MTNEFGAPQAATRSSWASSPAARATMQGNRRRDTRPELAIRRLLHARGRRYRVDWAPLPGLRRRADVVFRGPRVVVFVDGCYWHGCPTHYKTPVTNDSYWSAKIESNVRRDLDTNARLEQAGWRVLRFWEHEDPELACAAIEAHLDGPLSGA